MLNVEVKSFLVCFGHISIKIMIKIHRDRRKKIENYSVLGIKTIIGPRPLGGGAPGA